MKKELFQHVIDSSVEVAELFKKTNYVRLHFKCRTGKTATALRAVRLAGFERCLFVTKASETLNAVKSDYRDFRHELVAECDFVSYNSLHKIPTVNDYDCMIIDECHRINATPGHKIPLRAKNIMRIGEMLPQIHMSATPAAEGDGQLYWQLQCCRYAPLHGMKFKDFVDKYIKVIEKRTTANFTVKDYRLHKNNGIKDIIEPFTLVKEQVEANFTQIEPIEQFFRVKMSIGTDNMMKLMLRGGIIDFNGGLKAVAKTVTSERMKLHQLCGGGLIVENSKHEKSNLILDYSKLMNVVYQTANYKKVVIIYKFQFELELMQKAMQATALTTDLDTFKNTDVRYFAGQIQSKSEGIDLSIADVMVMYNIDHSAVTYLQIMERLKNTKRTKPVRIMFFTTEEGIDNEVLKRVRAKRDFDNAFYKQLKKTNILFR